MNPFPHLRLPLLLMLTAWAAPSSAAFQEMSVWILPEFDDVVFDKLVVEDSEVASLRECYLKCAWDQRCASFFHNQHTSVCRLLRGRYYVREGGRSEEGWRYYLMETSKRCPAMKGFIHRRDKGLCFGLVFKVIINRQDAISHCGQKGGHLMRVDSQEKHDLLVNQFLSSNATSADIRSSMGPRGYYIDGEYLNSTWVWSSTGQLVTYSNWYPGEEIPINVQFSIILSLDYDWQWVSVSPFQYRAFVCEIDM